MKDSEMFWLVGAILAAPHLSPLAALGGVIFAVGVAIIDSWRGR